MHCLYIVIEFLLIFSTDALIATDATTNVYGESNTLLQKFSNNKDYLTKEELVSLVQCSLDANNCYDSTLSSVTAYNPAEHLTNCDQNAAYCSAFSECMAATSLVEAITETYPRVNVSNLPQILSAIVSQSQLPGCHNSTSDSYSTVTTEEIRPSQAEIWGYGILFVTIISVCSLVGVSVLPFMAQDIYTTLLSALIGLAAGSLVASSAFHLIPQAFDLHGLYGNHDYVFPSLNIIIGLWAFLTIERIIKISMHQYGKRSEKPKGHSHDHHETVEYNPGETSVIRTVAWMIIFGDGVHNFLDGVAIGAAFSTSKLTGISVSLAIMCEELPHELGDFAVLLKAGMSLKQALSYNFLSATTCYLGLFLGILLGEFTQDISAVFGLAAGMFLYISCVDMIPEMNEELNTVAENGSAWEICKLMLLQNIGFALGVFSLFFLAYYQDEIVFE